MLWKYCSHIAMLAAIVFAISSMYVMLTTVAVFLPFILSGLAIGMTYVADGCRQKYNQQLITLNRWEFEELQESKEKP